MVADPDSVAQPHPVGQPLSFAYADYTDRLWSGVIDDVASIQPFAFGASTRIQRPLSPLRFGRGAIA